MNQFHLEGFIQDHYLVIGVMVMASVTLFTRVFPFVVFDNHKPGSGFRTLQNKLPATILVILVVYSLQSTPWHDWFQVILTALCLFSCVLLHLWKRNALISIFIPTIVFMAFQYV